MKFFSDKLWIHLAIAIMVLALSVAGCTKPDTSKPVPPAAPQDKPPADTLPSTPPEIPPVSSFFMDFGDFLQADSTSLNIDTPAPHFQQVSFISPDSDSLISGAEDIGERKNWGFAALNVGFWSAIVIVGLAVPVAAFVESFNHTPAQDPDYTWIWSYEVTVREGEYSAELHGKYIEQGVRWDMYISKQDAYDNFHWYWGESNLPATEGFWILRNKPSDPTDLIRIDWHRDRAEGTGDIRYTNIIPDGPENGGYISHGITTEELYDRFYDIYNKGKDNHTYIEWDGETDEGHVKDSRHFGDSKWHCWDSDHADIECP